MPTTPPASGSPLDEAAAAAAQARAALAPVLGPLPGEPPERHLARLRALQALVDDALARGPAAALAGPGDGGGADGAWAVRAPLAPGVSGPPSVSAQAGETAVEPPAAARGAAPAATAPAAAAAAAAAPAAETAEAEPDPDAEPAAPPRRAGGLLGDPRRRETLRGPALPPPAPPAEDPDARPRRDPALTFWAVQIVGWVVMAALALALAR